MAIWRDAFDHEAWHPSTPLGRGQLDWWLVAVPQMPDSWGRLSSSDVLDCGYAQPVLVDLNLTENRCCGEGRAVFARAGSTPTLAPSVSRRRRDDEASGREMRGGDGPLPGRSGPSWAALTGSRRASPRRRTSRSTAGSNRPTTTSPDPASAGHSPELSFAGCPRRVSCPGAVVDQVRPLTRPRQPGQGQTTDPVRRTGRPAR